MNIEINSLNVQREGPKKRVLFVITQSEFGGAQRFLHTLVTRLDKVRFEMLVAAGPASGITNQKSRIRSYELLDWFEKEEIKTRRLKYLQREIRPIEDLMAVLEIKKLIKEFNPDILFLLSSKAGFLGSLATALLSRFCQNRGSSTAKQSGRYHPTRPKVIYRIGGWTFNDPWPKWKKRLWILLERISARWKDYIIVNNKRDLEQARELKIKPREKIVLIYNGLDAYKMDFLSKEKARGKLRDLLPKWTSDVRWTSDVVNIVGTIANFYPPKGLKYLVEAAEHFKNKDTVVFVVIGDGQERPELENLIEQKCLQKKVLLLGQIPDAYKYLSAFDVFVLPSVKEGFPWIVIEAMAAKLPVVASGVGAVPEIIEDRKNGMIVEPSRPEQIAARIQELLDNDRLRQELGIQAHQTVLFKFPLDKMIKEVETLL